MIIVALGSITLSLSLAARLRRRAAGAEAVITVTSQPGRASGPGRLIFEVEAGGESSNL